MSAFELAGVLLTTIAVMGYLNQRFVKLPDTLGVTALGMLGSLAAMAYGHYDPNSMATAKEFVQSLNFPDLVFHGLLSFLLFAGAMHVDISGLKEQKLPVFLLATLGVLLSTGLVGYCVYLLLQYMGVEISLLWCFAFGALISPTDPVAVLGALKTSPMPNSVKNKIAGEALFNDASAVVAFVTLAGLASGAAVDLNFRSIAAKLAHEVFGAVGLGLLLGFGVTWLMARVRSTPIEIMMTLALATGGYSLCEYLHVSAPLGIVIMGLVVGSDGFGIIKNPKPKETLSIFWELVDELLNIVLFGMIGLLAITLSFKNIYFVLGFATIAIVLVARYISVGVPLGALRPSVVGRPLQAKILTWGGLRGGISVALALSLPYFEGRDLIQAITYMTVAFSILVQATTIGFLVDKWATGGRPLQVEVPGG